ncbi:hypothetical protein LOD38_00455 [Xylella fastidiosa subsp. multiplex]|uniref:BPSS1780 family membrane protein n=1 Tax=Xylella fastidiosa TaxID=2371 RepID=UPI001F43BF9D|nr:BPSS1780 family membrane protein [Xylella fastidiosa]MDC6410323.1 hypothetical protein [Xylella fastidiosa subsp. multiplex]MDC6413065.1 hypothetical protein [Xylella fastidiosa subsp. multiplex]MDD0862451.1 hypothetical protein [Xylella fastidiosa subsp. multiplex]MDD0873650.1 hypothetical protein [Xylella fastidiosa subsp. multiplex]MDD0875752.1 hypothetical protein [Xylella fastidiosa subsp. multiplex]
MLSGKGDNRRNVLRLLARYWSRKSMSEILKVPAKAGAQWLWAGFALLWRAPLRLGGLGLLWGMFSSLLMLVGFKWPSVLYYVLFLMFLVTPLLTGGVLWALREVDQGRTARPGDLLQGLYDGRVPQLLMALLPQLLALVVTFLVIHYSSLQGFSKFLGDLMTMHQPGAQINPEAIYQSYVDLPMPLIRLWLLFLCVIFVVVAMTLFVMPPQVMFQRDNGLHALKLSLYACLRNLPALLVFALLACIVTIVVFVIVSFIAIVPAAFIAAVLGRGDEVFFINFIHQVVMQLLWMPVFIPVFNGAVYAAWKQMLAHDALQSSPDEVLAA